MSKRIYTYLFVGIFGGGFMTFVLYNQLIAKPSAARAEAESIAINGGKFSRAQIIEQRAVWKKESDKKENLPRVMSQAGECIHGIKLYLLEYYSRESKWPTRQKVEESRPQTIEHCSKGGVASTIVGEQGEFTLKLNGPAVVDAFIVVTPYVDLEKRTMEWRCVGANVPRISSYITNCTALELETQ